MPTIRMRAGPHEFHGVLEVEKAPRTCQAIVGMLPYRSKVIHSRWSGEAVWIPLGELDLGLRFENHTSHGSRGDVLLYPGGVSETEILIVYGSSRFASKMGQLAGNHFLTISDNDKKLEELGKLVLWEGAQEIEFSIE